MNIIFETVKYTRFTLASNPHLLHYRLIFLMILNEDMGINAPIISEPWRAICSENGMSDFVNINLEACYISFTL